MKHWKRHLWMQGQFAALCAVLGAALLAGCNGGSGGPLNDNGGGSTPPPVAGTYSGNVTLASNTQANLTVQAKNDGTATGTLILPAPVVANTLSKRAAGDITVPLNGTVEQNTGDFSLTGSYNDGEAQVPVKVTGNVTQKAFTVVIGSGENTDSGSGTFTTTPTPTPTPVPTPTSPPASGGITMAQLVGAYRIDSITAPGGQTASCPGQLPSIGEVCGANHIIILNANGTVTSAAGDVENGTFTLANNTLVLRLGTETTTLALTLNGNTLTARETAFSNTANPNETSTGVINTLTKLAPVTAAQLAGTYRNVSITSPSGQTVSCPGSLPGSDVCGASDTLTFNANGTVTFKGTGEEAENGTFTIAGNVLTIHSGNETLTSVAYFDGNFLKTRELTYNNPADPSETPTMATSTYVRQ